MSNELEVFYIYYDGDDIGVKFEQAYLDSNIDALQKLSWSLSEIHEDIKAFVRTFDGWVVESGGDEGLIKVTASKKGVSECIRVLSLMWSRYLLTATIASGSTIQMAYQKVLDRKYKKRNFDGKALA